MKKRKEMRIREKETTQEKKRYNLRYKFLYRKE
jgi:hypothetical protein